MIIMGTNFNFKSQIATDKIQSERLLALGLKKETADMLIMSYSTGQDIIALPWSESGGWTRANSIPAWSLHRLIEIMPSNIKVKDDSAYLAINNNIVTYLYYYEDYAEMSSCIDFYMGKNIYDNLIYCIEWLINEGRFSKEYIK